MHLPFNMKKSILIPLFIIASSLTAYAQPALQRNHVRVSTRDSRYFEKDGKTWIPVMINYIVPYGQAEEPAFANIETYFRNFSANGGDAMRIWIS